MGPGVRLPDRGRAAVRRNEELVGMTLPEGEVIDIVAFGLLFVATAALASGSRTERATS